QHLDHRDPRADDRAGVGDAAVAEGGAGPDRRREGEGGQHPHGAAPRRARALCVVMLLSLRAVQARIDDVKASAGNTLTVTPAGARGFQGGGEPLTAAEIEKIRTTPHAEAGTAPL